MEGSQTTRKAQASKCPCCRYVLDGLAGNVCPECGIEIEYGLLVSSEFADSLAITKTWCTLGVISWGIAGAGYWFLSMLQIWVLNGYYPGKYSVHDIAGVYLRSSFVVAPIALCFGWWRGSSRTIYTKAVGRESPRAKVPLRCVIVSLPGILLTTGGLFLFLLLLSANG